MPVLPCAHVFGAHTFKDDNVGKTLSEHSTLLFDYTLLAVACAEQR